MVVRMENVGLYVLLALTVLFILRLYQYLRGHISPLPIAGRHVFIAGGSSGLGLEVAKECYLRGALVTILARDRDKLASARREIEALTAGKVQALPADVLREEQVRSALEEAEKAFGPVHFFLFCVGKTLPGFVDAEMSLYKQALEVNFLSVLCPVQLIAKGMKKAGAGLICLVSDEAVLLKTPGLAPTTPAKAAVKSLADWIRPDLRRYNISVHVFYPPAMSTPGYFDSKSRKNKAVFAYEGQAISPKQAALALLSGISVGESDIVVNDTAVMYRAISMNGGRRGILLFDAVLYALLDAIVAPIAVAFGHFRAKMMRFAVGRAKRTGRYS